MQLTRRKAIALTDAAAGKKIFGTKHSVCVSETLFGEVFQEMSGMKQSQMVAVLTEIKRTLLVMFKMGGTVQVPVIGNFRLFGTGQEVQEGSADEGTPISLEVSLLVDKGLKTAVATPGVIPYSIVEQAQIIPLISSVKDLATGTFNQVLTPDGLLDIRGTNLKFDPTKANQGLYLVPTDPAGETLKFSKMQVPQGTRLMPVVPIELVSGTSYWLEVRATPRGTNGLRIGRYTPIFTVE